MRIIARRTLREFVASRARHKDHSALKAALDAWFDEVRKAHWRSASDIRRLYATASIVSSIGLSYRLILRRASPGSSGSGRITTTIAST
jgi:mRNA-degrading endonuclease HigB of HigAB toxin-antitoxin module